MTTPDQIDRAALCRRIANVLGTMSAQGYIDTEAMRAHRDELLAVAHILDDGSLRAAPAGEQVVSNCDLTDPNNWARQQFMSTTPPAEKPVAIVRQRRRKEGRMNVVDTETHFLDEHCGADLPDGTKLYAHPPAPRGVTVTQQQFENWFNRAVWLEYDEFGNPTNTVPQGWSDPRYGDYLVRHTIALGAWNAALTAALGGESRTGNGHSSDCATSDGPAYEPGQCDCNHLAGEVGDQP